MDFHREEVPDDWYKVSVSIGFPAHPSEILLDVLHVHFYTVYPLLSIDLH
ncbi:hypothetical protein F9C07_197 [Aspergillus flavus]|uniref:Uncharacterized protein n=1 Tax=Aspergillus flavus (strain ATCC 200026 / FGSC A1120 / IAM 13836 / NRRL 3357 / JCM 12722 / SRRC 167) TaxID=332952 RepID=A0A7U2QWB4_ASPFN|nr:hypothetical protein F9C07_197 [Aspergillus flavus]